MRTVTIITEVRQDCMAYIGLILAYQAIARGRRNVVNPSPSRQATIRDPGYCDLRSCIVLKVLTLDSEQTCHDTLFDGSGKGFLS